MKATLKRQYLKGSVKGHLTTSTGFECDTLELAWLNNERAKSCIPEGTYKVVPRNSKKYGDHLHVTDVPDRSLILIHWGNYAGSKNPKTGESDIKGCLLTGYGYADFDRDGNPEIMNSKKAFNDLMLHAPDGFTLTIISDSPQV